MKKGRSLSFGDIGTDLPLITHADAVAQGDGGAGHHAEVERGCVKWRGVQGEDKR